MTDNGWAKRCNHTYRSEIILLGMGIFSHPLFSKFDLMKPLHFQVLSILHTTFQDPGFPGKSPFPRPRNASIFVAKKRELLPTIFPGRYRF